MSVNASFAAAIAAEHGTPVYVYDSATIHRRLDDLETGLTYGPRRVFYSVKANPAVAIAALMRARGIGLDACSPGDLAVARLAGARREDISFTGFGLTDAEFRLAAASSAALVIDDAADLPRTAALSDPPQIGIRIAPAISAGFHEHVHAGAADSKFGVPVAALEGFFAEAERFGVPIAGLHAHMGSDVSAGEPYRALLETLAGIAVQRQEIRWINIGGGFGTPREPDEAPFPWCRLNGDADRLLGPLEVELRLEPGAYLTMDAGEVLTRVVGVKPALGERPLTVIVDANTNMLASTLLYRSMHPVAALGPHRGQPGPTRVVGNLMQAGDVLLRDVALPPLEPGDLVSIGCAGAYAACRAPAFNERPRPAELLVDGDGVRIVRRAETLAELVARDVTKP